MELKEAAIQSMYVKANIHRVTFVADVINIDELHFQKSAENLPARLE